jgi:hypothetical protein
MFVLYTKFVFEVMEKAKSMLGQKKPKPLYGSRENG